MAVREKLIDALQEASDDFVELRTEGGGAVNFMVTIHWDRVADAALEVIFGKQEK